MEPHSDTLTIPQIQKGKTRVRNDAKWESLKGDIFRIYMTEDNTLSVTMLMIEQMHRFKRSPRKWKEKLKEWNFEKNLTKKEMKIVIAKAERRATEEGKDTIFFHHGNMIPPAKVSMWKKRITKISSGPFDPYAKIPTAIAYFTPQYGIRLGQHIDVNNQPVDSLAGIEGPEVDLKVAEDNFFVFEPFNRGRAHISHSPVPFSSFVDPTDCEAAQIYYELKVTQDSMICRFSSNFIRLLFQNTPVIEALSSLSNAMVLNSFGNASQSLIRRLVELLGQALVKNYDLERAIPLAEIMSKVANSRNYYNHYHPSPSCFLGWWLHCGGFYEESIRYLEDAFLYDLKEAAPTKVYQEYLPSSAADILHQSYQQLAPAHDWREICDRVLKPKEVPFSDRVWRTVHQATSEFTSPTGIIERAFWDDMDRIKHMFPLFLAHILQPAPEAARLYANFVAWHLYRDSFDKCASNLHSVLIALRSTNEFDRCKSCVEEAKKFIDYVVQIEQLLGRKSYGNRVARHAHRVNLCVVGYCAVRCCILGIDQDFDPRSFGLERIANTPEEMEKLLVNLLPDDIPSYGRLPSVAFGKCTHQGGEESADSVVEEAVREK